MSEYHVPILLDESIDGLLTDSAGVYVDVTYGGGGHSRRILEQLANKAKLYGIDRDIDAHQNSLVDNRLTLIKGNFRYLQKYMRLYGELEVDGVLADLGVSSHQFDVMDRGFSYRGEAMLDMRMNQDQEMTAKHIINEYSENELVRIFSRYGEIRNSKTIAKVIVNARLQAKIETTSFLIDCLDPYIKGSRLRYLSQLFQALRIEVNQEMKALEEFLNDCTKVIRRGGRLSIITYHSIEDRLVKRFIKSGNVQGKIDQDGFGHRIRPFVEVNRKVIVPTAKEIKSNSRARSAKLRIAERV